MNDKGILKEMYQQFLEERKEVQNLLNKNLTRISEIEGYLKSIYNQEESDFKVFSPRSVENVYKEKIDENNTEKRLLQIENQTYYKRINKLDYYLEGLKTVVPVDTVDATSGNKEIVFSNLCDDVNIDSNLMILDVQEKERQRIARDLHDTSLQNLAHLVHKIELSSMFIDQDPIRAKLELIAVNKNLKTIIEEIRNTIFDLRPMSFDDLGLDEAFERLFAKLKQENPGIDFRFHMEQCNCQNDQILMTIFRVVKESCDNAVKHANADQIEVFIKNYQDNYEITVKDNGIGFDIQDVLEKKEKHFGLLVIKERIELLGGSVIIKSSVDEGTTILITIPLKNIERAKRNEY